jgi:hypothetical protein
MSSAEDIDISKRRKVGYIEAFDHINSIHPI